MRFRATRSAGSVWPSTPGHPLPGQRSLGGQRVGPVLRRSRYRCTARPAARRGHRGVSMGATDQSTSIDEKTARAVAEAARDAGTDRPSFAQGLYLGRVDFGLIQPHPRPSPEETARGEAFLEKLRAAVVHFDGRRIEREARIPDEYIATMADLGVFGM